jgi:16S rRNA (uracil1498-N3)-methyltransferase
VQVLRLAVGAEVCLFDAAGREADALLTRVERGRCECAVQPPRAAQAPRARLHLVIGIPKAAKLEMIVRMVTELGVHAVYLAHTERSVPKLSADSPKLERLRRITIEACAQSGQPWAPQLTGPITLDRAAAAAPGEAEKWLFWENSKRPLGLQSVASSGARDVWAVVGPEGGISEREVDVLRQLGFVDIGLGAGILRVETACVAVATLLLDRMGLLR